MAAPTFKTLVNPSGVSTVTVKKLGITLDPLEERAIEIREYPDLVQDEVFDELSALIDSGDLQVKDHIGLITDAQEAKDYLLYPHFGRSARFEVPSYPGIKQFIEKTIQKAIEESFPTILKDNISVRGTTRNLNFIGSEFIVNDNGVNERVDVSLDITGDDLDLVCCRTQAHLLICRTLCSIVHCRTT
jgi:hypothetical protein